MKKGFIFLLAILSLLTLTSCRISAPELLEEYETEKVKYKQVDRKEWVFTEINEEYSFLTGYIINDSNTFNHFLRFYKNNKKVYEEKCKDSFYINDYAFMNNHIYMNYWQRILDEGQIKYLNYFVEYDLEFNKNILLIDYERVCDAFYLEDRIVYLRTTRDTQLSSLIELDYSGKVIRQKDFDVEFYDLYIDKGNYYLLKEIFSEEFEIYKYSFDEDLQSVYKAAGHILKYINIQNGIVQYIDEERYGATNLLHYYDGTELKTILRMPTEEYKDLYYSIQIPVIYNGDVFIPVVVNPSGMSIYRRVIVFHYDHQTEQVKAIYINKICSSVFTKDKYMFIGSYHDTDKDGIPKGTFYSLDLDVISSTEWK
ncbi:MAG: hypothetical protein K2N65_03300 [Anaeroplasmataceae bacterium]|nr:hypothetical protein [Anaeroplasmataceae bacterium]